MVKYMEIDKSSYLIHNLYIDFYESLRGKKLIS